MFLFFSFSFNYFIHLSIFVKRFYHNKMKSDGDVETFVKGKSITVFIYRKSFLKAIL